MREQAGVPFSRLTTLRIGGPAARLVEASTEGELVDTVRAADAHGDKVLILGGGSNLVVADEGFDGVVVRVAHRGVELSADGRLTAAAGEDWDALVAASVDSGHSGVEALSGIPGLVGATPIQNVGAYGQEVAQTVESVRVLDRVTSQIRTLAGADCGFGYRTSALKGHSRYVVLAVTYRLASGGAGTAVRYAELARRLEVALGDPAAAADVREAVLELRRGKGMLLDPADHDTWSAGSFFTNPVLPEAVAAELLPADAPRWSGGDGLVKTSAAWLIEQSGYRKGHGSGPVRLSSKHTLALTNQGGATTADLLALATEIRDGVESRFGVRLVPEPTLVGCALGTPPL